MLFGYFSHNVILAEDFVGPGLSFPAHTLQRENADCFRSAASVSAISPVLGAMIRSITFRA
jgi:hypothetical protein